MHATGCCHTNLQVLLFSTYKRTQPMQPHALSCVQSGSSLHTTSARQPRTHACMRVCTQAFTQQGPADACMQACMQHWSALTLPGGSCRSLDSTLRDTSVSRLAGLGSPPSGPPPSPPRTPPPPRGRYFAFPSPDAMATVRVRWAKRRRAGQRCEHGGRTGAPNRQEGRLATGPGSAWRRS
eukprot:365451-Chlamydomonas_euryale.AAC.11